MSLLKGKFVRVLMITLVTVLLAGTPVLANDYLFGHDSLYMGDEWMKVTDKAVHFYAEENGWEVITQNADFKVQDQVKQLRYFVEKGVDGILWSPVDAQATADIAEYCKEQGVPTITYNTDVNSDAVPLNIRFGAKKSARLLAEEVIDYLKETQGTPSGLVISLQGDKANDSDRERAEGYKEVFSQYEDIELIEYYTQSDTGTAQTRAFNAIQQHGRPVAIVSQNTLNARGGINALERADMLVERDKEDHVFIASIGASPGYIDLMEEGYVDRGLVQPNLFYGPLAMHYLKLIIEEGEEALPEVGETVTAEDVNIEGGTYDGVAPWDEPVWAPAEVVENYGHKWLKVQGIMVTPDNMHDPKIWGNAAEAWLD